MSRSLHALVAFALVASIGCGGDDFVADAPTGDAGPEAQADTGTVDGAIEAGTDAVAEATTDAPVEAAQPDAPIDTGPTCTSTKSSEAVVEADGVIIDGNCNGSISFLSGPFANLGMGRGLVRFHLSTATATAFAEGRVVSLRLELKRATSCDGASCPSDAGFISALPLRNDWDEGTIQPYSGADWCRRLGGSTGESWNAPGADQDHGAVAAEVPVSELQPDVMMELDPAPFTTEWVKGGRLSLLLIADEATFVFITREGAMQNAPRLVVEYCDE